MINKNETSFHHVQMNGADVKKRSNQALVTFGCSLVTAVRNVFCCLCRLHLIMLGGDSPTLMRRCPESYPVYHRKQSLPSHWWMCLFLLCHLALWCTSVVVSSLWSDIALVPFIFLFISLWQKSLSLPLHINTHPRTRTHTHSTNTGFPIIFETFFFLTLNWN